MKRTARHIIAFGKWLAGSFECGEHGASEKNLAAFTCIVFAGYCHQFITPQTASTFLVIDLSTCLLALGIVTMHQLIRLKNGDSVIKEKPNGTEQAIDT